MCVFSCERKSDVFAAGCLPYTAPLDRPFVVELADCFGGFPARPSLSWTGGANPITGPLRFEGIMPGDTIAVTVQDLTPVGDGFFGTPDQRLCVPIDRQTGVVRLPGGIRVPLAAHVGTIGVTPAGSACSTQDAGDHGGNMDCNLIRAGATLCFGVQTPGAGLGLGDVHAVMGDGEVGGQGVETAARATLLVRKVPGLSVRRPYGVYRDVLFVIGWGDTLTTAADKAQADLEHLLHDALDLEPPTIRRLLSVMADLRVCWRGGRTPCMRMELPLGHLPADVRRRLLAAMEVTPS